MRRKQRRQVRCRQAMAQVGGEHSFHVTRVGNGMLGDQSLESIRLCESATGKRAVSELKGGEKAHLRRGNRAASLAASLLEER